MSRVEQQFQKGLRLLDSGDVVRGEALLRNVLASDEASCDRVLDASVRCCLGELMVDLGRVDEAAAFLTPVAALDEYDDSVAHERRRAHELLRQLGRG